jgi:hypothetical protein
LLYLSGGRTMETALEGKPMHASETGVRTAAGDVLFYN